MVRRSDVFRLKSGAVVVVIDQPQSNQAGVNCMVIGGMSTIYPQYGHDIYCFFTDLQAAEKLEVK